MTVRVQNDDPARGRPVQSSTGKEDPIGSKWNRVGLAFFLVYTAGFAWAVANEGTKVMALSFVLLGLSAWHLLGIRRSSVEHFVFYALIASYATLAVLNSYVIDLPGTMPDSWTFHRQAIHRATEGHFDFGIDYLFHVNILALLYYITSGSYLLASALSVLAMALALVFLVRLSHELELNDRIHWAFIVCGIAPTFVLLCPAPMRESFQVMLLCATFYYGSYALRNGSSHAVLMMVAAATAFGLFHKGMLFVALCMVSVYVLVFVKRNVGLKRKQAWMIFAALGAMFGLAYIVVVFTEAGRTLVAGLFKEDLFWSIWHYRTSIDDIGSPRTAYGIVFDHENAWTGTLSIVKAYLWYMFYPLLPPEGAGVRDMYAVTETWLRIVAWCVLLVGMEKRYRPIPATTIAMILVYIALSGAWSLGTTNYGQGVRHHVLDNVVLIVLVLESASRIKAARRSRHTAAHLRPDRR